MARMRLIPSLEKRRQGTADASSDSRAGDHSLDRASATKLWRRIRMRRPAIAFRAVRRPLRVRAIEIHRRAGELLLPRRALVGAWIRLHRPRNRRVESAEDRGG